MKVVALGRMNIDPNWLLRMAEKEGNKIVSVGGLVTEIGDKENSVNQTPFKKHLELESMVKSALQRNEPESTIAVIDLGLLIGVAEEWDHVVSLLDALRHFHRHFHSAHGCGGLEGECWACQEEDRLAEHNKEGQ